MEIFTPKIHSVTRPQNHGFSHQKFVNTAPKLEFFTPKIRSVTRPQNHGFSHPNFPVLKQSLRRHAAPKSDFFTPKRRPPLASIIAKERPQTRGFSPQNPVVWKWNHSSETQPPKPDFFHTKLSCSINAIIAAPNPAFFTPKIPFPARETNSAPRSPKSGPFHPKPNPDFTPFHTTTQRPFCCATTKPHSASPHPKIPVFHPKIPHPALSFPPPRFRFRSLTPPPFSLSSNQRSAPRRRPPEGLRRRRARGSAPSPRFAQTGAATPRGGGGGRGVTGTPPKETQTHFRGGRPPPLFPPPQ